MLAASWQDRDGGKTALLGMYQTSPVQYVFADQGFAGRFVDWARDTRRLARDYERRPEVSEAIIRWAAINGMLRRITRGNPARRQLRRAFTRP